MKSASFSGIGGSASKLDAARASNAAALKRTLDFRTEFSALRNEDGFSLEAVRKFCFEDRKLDTFQSSELMRIYTTFRQLRSFEDMVRLYEESTNEEFTSSQIVKEFYAVACNHTGRYAQAISTAEWLISHGTGNGEVYGTIGKALFKRYEICNDYLNLFNSERQEELIAAYQENFPDDPMMERVAENARACLIRSGAYYESGFLQAFESYPGINAVYAMIEAGNHQKAKSMARLVHLACLRDGARDTMDHTCANNLLEAACIMGGSRAEIEEATEKFLSLDVSKTRLQRTVAVLTKMRGHFERCGISTNSFDLALGRLDAVLQHHGRESFNLAAQKPAKDSLTEAMHKISSSYRGMASNFLGGHFVPGNFMFGGQLPDHYLTRTDWQEFERLLDMPVDLLLQGEDPGFEAAGIRNLRDIETPEQFMSVADKIVRRAFGTDEDDLEIINSAGHFQYDETVNALLYLSGADMYKGADSRTNISVIMGLGLGDCRQHAQAKQILFDAWQKHHMNFWLRKAYSALDKDGDVRRYQECIEKFREIEQVELRTIDASVMAPIKMKERYVPECAADGSPILAADGELGDVENHTLTVLLKHDQKGVLKSLHFADSFYQKHYDWGRGEIPLEQLRFNEKGTLVLPAKTMSVLNLDTGENVSVPVQLVPARYTGKKDQVSRDEHGKLLLLGIKVDEDFSLARQLLRSRNEKKAALSSVRKWYLENGPVPESLKVRQESAANQRANKTPQRRTPDQGL